LEDLDRSGGSQGTLEPQVELREVSAYLSLGPLLLGRTQATDIEHLENVFSPAQGTPLVDTQGAPLVDVAFDEVGLPFLGG
jgi:hypothetical protein